MGINRVIFTTIADEGIQTIREREAAIRQTIRRGQVYVTGLFKKKKVSSNID